MSRSSINVDVVITIISLVKTILLDCCRHIFDKLVGFKIFWLRAYLMKVVLETRRAQ